MSDEKKETPKFKNKRERNEGHVTEAMRIFGNSEMLLARPDHMTREEYQVLRKIQTMVLKQLFHKGHSPSRKLNGIMGVRQPSVRIAPGVKRRVTQRKSS